ncbi:type II toxin-antitoxin system RelE/ParE family toxin [Tetragenococcus koreensis]|uniref:type II toxin-antitoxin system RelE family toxin n=1 Tax=Tetragenococcus koreensis TaxID=290335 RepID=UPI001F22A1B6|nr:type II toxin-antitoxin system RelE/ParE family toxin [Tetragenococcus koreensis]MDN6730776.1 type II toxin-antitoxin system RelE/ParE family toxin [Atopostipes suicloacalis]MCF1615454.1 type II toxin-antitoxin system RelE/ParE family toxin [Tetragenococcus koreensis]MCF1625252.1 type II toxin-antitoxin system RelE/ParE family toxin [Tetragenococcus koreensis]MCF1627948.1 type II toxin-antitoxin system RelE/ParE family toxin [Tetragenococcus koreensis]MDN5810620.1 type II toxin-antitoxin sy
MSYNVRYEKKAQKNLKKLDKFQAKIIMNWVEKHLINCDDPRIYGKGLTGDKSDCWRYRVGDYRIIADIKDSEVTILILEVGHRRDIYKKIR